MSWLDTLADRQVLVIVIPALAIVVGALLTLLKCSMSHRERMAMIKRGLHPDDLRARRELETDQFSA